MLHLVSDYELIASTVSDGTRATTNRGVSVTPGNNAYDAYAEIIGDTSADAHLIEININSGGSSSAARDMLVTIGRDPAGGTSYTDWIEHLLCSCSSVFMSGSQPCGGVTYRFPIFVPAGTALAAKASVNNATVGTVRVAAKLYRARRPEAVRVGSFVRTFGETTASSSGTSVTPGGASEGSYVQLGSALAEPLWAWEFGLGVNNGTMTNTAHEVDIAVGDASNKKIVISNGIVFEGSVEVLGKPPQGLWLAQAAVGDLVYGRVQSGPNNATANTSIMAYGVGG